MGEDPIEERLREFIIGEIEPQAIVIADYDPAWPERFLSEEAKIRAALGQAAFAVEHVGSTSVPGLAAKPIVDVLLVVEDSADEASYLPALEQAGYVLRVREQDFEGHRMFRTPEKDVHVHVLLGWLRGDRAPPAATRPPARGRRGLRSVRQHQARTGEQGLAERAALRRREVGSRRGYPRPSRRGIFSRRLALASPHGPCGRFSERLPRAGE